MSAAEGQTPDVVKSPDYRENPKRSIFIQGEITQATVHQLTPEILRLRDGCSEPITVYIDSVGGSTAAAETLLNLLRAPSHDGEVCRVITVVTGLAASAAADFLAAGDYAIAYPHAGIHCHGTRRKYNEHLTTEQASSLAALLKSSNEGFAQRLANRGIHRFIFNFLNAREEFPSWRNEQPDLTDVECMAKALQVEVFTDLTAQALQAFQQTEKLRAAVAPQLEALSGNPPGAEEALKEAQLLVSIISFELDNGAGKFSVGGFQQAQDDFTMLLDYASRRHTRILNRLVRRWGAFFLNTEEEPEFKALPQTTREEREAAFVWLGEKVAARIKPLWHYYFAICRLLQSGEHELDADEAYWLGLVDEVIGSGLRNVREIVEAAGRP